MVWNYVIMYFVVIIIIITAVIMWVELTFIEYILNATSRRSTLCALFHLITWPVSPGYWEIQPFWFQNLCYLLVHLHYSFSKSEFFFSKSNLKFGLQGYIEHSKITYVRNKLMLPIKMCPFNTFEYICIWSFLLNEKPQI